MNDEDVSGCANCSLPVLSSDGSRTAWNIWCIDSGDYIRDGGFNIIKDAGYGSFNPRARAIIPTETGTAAD